MNTTMIRSRGVPQDLTGPALDFIRPFSEMTQCAPSWSEGTLSGIESILPLLVVSVHVSPTCCVSNCLEMNVECQADFCFARFSVNLA